MSQDPVLQENSVTEIIKSTPSAIQIVCPDEENGKYKFDKQAFEELIKNNGVEDLPVVVVSVAGAFRKGKSFLLNFIVRYLSSENKNDWLGADDEPLEGFSWKNGSDRDTTGILLWSEIFKVEKEDGKKVAVMLMDTQGAFDGESSMRECVTIFALSTMVSSLQIYNLSQQVQEDDLQHLGLFTEYGRMAKGESDLKPFQSLKFLVRDWSYPYDHPYGDEGGASLLQKRLKVTEEKHEDLKEVRQHIHSCFEDISCYLMPHPGLNVATDRNFNGSLNNIRTEFKQHINNFVPSLFDPQDMKVKSINGSEVTCKEIVDYFMSYMNVYNKDDLPKPKSMLQATAEVSNLNLVKKCRDAYKDRMEKLFENIKYMNPEKLTKEHEKIKGKILSEFDETKKLGNTEFVATYKLQLENEIKESFVGYNDRNDKNLAENTRGTLFMLVILSVVLYVLGGMFSFISIPYFPISSVINTLFYACVSSLLLWCVCKVLDKHHKMTNLIDEGSKYAYENVLILAVSVVWCYILKKIMESQQPKKKAKAD